MRSCTGQRRQAEVAAELGAVVGTEPRDNEVYLRRDGFHGRFEVRHGGSVDVSLTVDAETAAAVARVVTGDPPRRPPTAEESKEHPCL